MRQIQANTDEIRFHGKRLLPHLPRTLPKDLRSCGANDRLVVVVRSGCWSQEIWELGETDARKYDELSRTRYAEFFTVSSEVIDRGPPN